MDFMQQIKSAWRRQNSLLCVGLDPDPGRFPPQFNGSASAIFDFCRAIIDATAPFACAFKPQIAYFSAYQAEPALQALIEYVHQHYPELPVILDAKRGDIGSSAEQYAAEAFTRYAADAITANPYLGFDAVQPFIDYHEKGVILLCRTSNPGSSDFQSLLVHQPNQSSPTMPLAGDQSDPATEAQPLYEYVAKTIATKWNAAGNCALVMGATYPAELHRVRALVGDMPLLVPGIGAQGGDIHATVVAGQTAQGEGLIINSSRAILYASHSEEFAVAASSVARETRDQINLARISHNATS